MKTIYLTKTYLLDMLRQKSIIFSSFILPVVIIWATWWVTADFPMTFRLDSNKIISTGMIDVHVVTGGLTAMGITAGLFSFIITAEYQNIAKRLRQVGYHSTSLNSSILLALTSVLILTSIVAITLSVLLADPVSKIGIIFAILLVTIIYASLGNMIGTIYPNTTAGSLFILIFSFIDLMLFTNPMGEGLYLQSWTYFIPGFWPVQIALESGFIGYPKNILLMLFKGIMYALSLLSISFISRRFGLILEVK